MRTKCVDNKAEAGVATVLCLAWQFLSSMFVSVQDKLSEADDRTQSLVATAAYHSWTSNVSYVQYLQ